MPLGQETAKSLRGKQRIIAETAKAFGIDPINIAMLSYSTGTSGGGEDVDFVRKATELGITVLNEDGLKDLLGEG